VEIEDRQDLYPRIRKSLLQGAYSEMADCW